MEDREQLGVLRVLAAAEALGPRGGEQLLSVLQIELPDTDWFALAAERAPWFRLTSRDDDPVVAETESQDGPTGSG